jgi:hypothetical protein
VSCPPPDVAELGSAMEAGPLGGVSSALAVPDPSSNIASTASSANGTLNSLNTVPPWGRSNSGSELYHELQVTSELVRHNSGASPRRVVAGV